MVWCKFCSRSAGSKTFYYTIGNGTTEIKEAFYFHKSCFPKFEASEYSKKEDSHLFQFGIVKSKAVELY